MSKYNLITVEAELVLLRNDDIFDRGDGEKKKCLRRIPRKDKLKPKTYRKLLSFVKSEAKNTENIHMHLFYTGGFSSSMRMIEDLTVSEKKGRIVVSAKVQYILLTPITSKKLKSEVLGIFRHWSNSGDVEYGLTQFKFASKSRRSGYMVTKNERIFHNFVCSIQGD